MKVDYVTRETANNLRRNITLTISAIMTVAVSLALFGSTLLLRQGVDNVSARWRDGVEVIVLGGVIGAAGTGGALRRFLKV